MAKQLNWHRTAGAFSVSTAPSEPCAATVGFAAHRCDCCGEEYIVVACVAEDGSETSVAIPIEQLPDLRAALLGAATELQFTRVTN